MSSDRVNEYKDKIAKKERVVILASPLNRKDISGAAEISIVHIPHKGSVAIFENLLVAEPHRRNKLSEVLTEERIYWCQKNEITRAESYVAADNIASLVPKMRLGFYIKEITVQNIPGKYQYTLEKRFGNDKPWNISDEYQETEMSDIAAIRDLLSKGWVGVKVLQRKGFYQEKEIIFDFKRCP